MAFHLLHANMVFFVSSPQQETNMFEFQLRTVIKKKKIVIRIPVILHANFLEYHRPPSLGIKHQAVVKPQCGYPKIW